MGLRSFVALPVEKNGVVLRALNSYAAKSKTNTLIGNIAYGIDSRQTLLLASPYMTSPEQKSGDLSLLYRYMFKQEDSQQGTSRFGFLGGGVIPTSSSSDYALQAGGVYTFFYGRNEIDVDGLYRLGVDNRADSARYDLSWQYRLFPSIRDDWGLTQEFNSVLEFNGRWREGYSINQQITLGLQWIHPKWVLEGGYVQTLNNEKERSYLLSIRTHF